MMIIVTYQSEAKLIKLNIAYPGKIDCIGVSCMRRKITLVALTIALILVFALAGCGSTNLARQLPPEITKFPANVQQAYHFALDHPEVLEAVPCYCGCGVMGHTSNLSCFVAGQDARGEVIYDYHALGCSICVDIALDSQRLFEQGKPLGEIKTYIDQTYSWYGPPTP